MGSTKKYCKKIGVKVRLFVIFKQKGFNTNPTRKYYSRSTYFFNPLTAFLE